MAWKIEIDSQASRDLRKLDPAIAREIVQYLKQRIATSEDPRDFGQALGGNKFGLWRYRVRDYRIICQIEDHHLVVVVITVGHRSTIYDD